LFIFPAAETIRERHASARTYFSRYRGNNGKVARVGYDCVPRRTPTRKKETTRCRGAVRTIDATCNHLTNGTDRFFRYESRRETEKEIQQKRFQALEIQQRVSSFMKFLNQNQF
jgi:hypothetical protein